MIMGTSHHSQMTRSTAIFMTFTNVVGFSMIKILSVPYMHDKMFSNIPVMQRISVHFRYLKPFILIEWEDDLIMITQGQK